MRVSIVRRDKTYRSGLCTYGLLSIGVVITLLLSTTHASQIAPSMNVDISVLYPTNSFQEGMVFITLSNLETAPVESLNLSIGSINGPIANRSIPLLVGEQSQVVPVAIPPSNASQLVLIVQYRQNGIQHSQVKIVELKSSYNDFSSKFEVLLPAIVGGFLALIGVFVASLFTAMRESNRTKFEWGKFLFERYEQYYREFMFGLAGTLNANQIKEYFKRLDNSAFVPNNLRTKVKDTLIVLESATGTEQKRVTRDNLLYDFEAFMQKPWDS